jgi:hypothetical protein
MKTIILCQLVAFSANYARIKTEEGYFFDVSLKNPSVRIQLAILRNQGVSSFEFFVELRSVLVFIEQLQVAIPMLVAKKIQAAAQAHNANFELA